MFNVICVSARQLSTDFLKSIEMIAQSNVEAIVLREKDLSENEYLLLAKDVKKICDKHNKKLIIHNFIYVAKKLGITNIQLPFSKFISEPYLHKDFESIGRSEEHTSELQSR